MKILVSYHSDLKFTGYAWEKYLKALGHDAVELYLETTPYWTDFRGFLPFYVPKGRPLSVQDFEKKNKPAFDCAIEVDGVGQFHLAGGRRASCPRAFWSLDTYRRDKQKFHKWMENDFDVIFVAHKNQQALFKKPAFWLPYGCDPEVYHGFDGGKVHDVAFVGQMDPKNYPERFRMLESLKKNFKVDIARVYSGGASEIYSRSKMVFNKSHSGEINMRVFEVLSSGSLLMTDRLAPEMGLEDLFQDGKHLVMYDGEADLIQKVRYYLEHDEERERIARAGQAEAHSKHTYTHRFRAIMEKIRETGRRA